jgi:hypothetical protein
METPPRAWGRPHTELSLHLYLGNTPTGVGKTCPVEIEVIKIEKHPHGRGEDVLPIIRGMREAETPPRAWGRHQQGGVGVLKSGNTPTGVGKTRRLSRALPSPRKHPHGRGEDEPTHLIIKRCAETPPRAWGRRSHGPAGRRR